MLLARYGVQLPFKDAWLLNVIFDARNLHGARNVCMHPEIHHSLRKSLTLDIQNYQSDSEYQGIERLWYIAGRVNRVAFVEYFPHAAIYRTGNYSLAPSVDFGNTGTLSRAEAKVKTFAGSGEHILGSAIDAKSRMAREASYAYLNTLAQCGLRLKDSTAKSMLSQVQFQDPSTKDWTNVKLPELDALDPIDAPKVQKLRSHLAYYYRLRKSLLLNINNNEFFPHQARLLEQFKASGKDAQYRPIKPSDFRQSIALKPSHTDRGKSVRIIVPSGDSDSLEPSSPNNTIQTLKPSHTNRGKSVHIIVPSGNSDSLEPSNPNNTIQTLQSGVMQATNMDPPPAILQDEENSGKKKSKKRKRPEESEDRGAVGEVRYIPMNLYYY